MTDCTRPASDDEKPLRIKRQELRLMNCNQKASIQRSPTVADRIAPQRNFTQLM